MCAIRRVEVVEVDADDGGEAGDGAGLETERGGARGVVVAEVVAAEIEEGVAEDAREDARGGGARDGVLDARRGDVEGGERRSRRGDRASLAEALEQELDDGRGRRTGGRPDGLGDVVATRGETFHARQRETRGMAHPRERRDHRRANVGVLLRLERAEERRRRALGRDVHEGIRPETARAAVVDVDTVVDRSVVVVRARGRLRRVQSQAKQLLRHAAHSPPRLSGAAASTAHREVDPAPAPTGGPRRRGSIRNALDALTRRDDA